MNTPYFQFSSFFFKKVFVMYQILKVVNSDWFLRWGKQKVLCLIIAYNILKLYPLLSFFFFWLRSTYDRKVCDNFLRIFCFTCSRFTGDKHGLIFAILKVRKLKFRSYLDKLSSLKFLYMLLILQFWCEFFFWYNLLSVFFSVFN